MKKAVICSLLLAYCLPLTAYCFSQEIPVDIRADDLKYIEGTSLIEASGSVEVKLKDVTIRADRLLMDSVTNIATAEGGVVLITKDYTSRSDRLFYEADTEESRLTGFRTELSPAGMEGKLYLSADRLEDAKGAMRGGPGELTTCDRGEPHYFMRGSRIEYYPDDRIVGQNVVTYVGRTPVLWMPYFFYDFKNRWKKNWVYGRNEVEGEYIKTAWDYPGGTLLIDNMQKKGWGVGVEAMLGTGALYLYLLDEKDTGLRDRVLKYDQRFSLTPATNLNLNARYSNIYMIPSGRQDQTGFDLSLTSDAPYRRNIKLGVLDDRAALYQKYSLQFDQSAGRSSFSYSNNYELAKNDPKWMRNSQRLNFSLPILPDRVDFSSSTNYYHSSAFAGDSGQERIEPQIELRGSENKFSWRYTQNWFLDLRQDLYPGVARYEFLEKQPELEIYPQDMDLKLFTLQSTFGLGYYREVRYVPLLGKNRDYAAQRYRASLNASRTLPVGAKSSLTLAAGLDQFAYGPGDQLYAFRESAGLRSDPLPFFRNDLNFRQGYTEGNTPFLFDKLGTSYHDLREKMTIYYLDKFSWETDGGYNWQTTKWFDVMSGLTFSPDRRMRLRLHSGWDIENRIYKDLVFGLALLPTSAFSAELNFTQDMNIGQLRSASALYDIFFLQGADNETHLRLNQVFDAASREFKVRDIMMVRDLHCWEMKFTYSDYLKQVSFSFNLKALPGEPVGFSTGRGFYYEGGSLRY